LNCWKPGTSKIYGEGIHPEESSICRAALIDRAIPLVGGVIGISALTGLEKYDEGQNQNLGLEVLGHSSSMKSFSVFKVDNIDFVAGDMRIVDAMGEISNEGRVEIRNNGVWGTICAE